MQAYAEAVQRCKQLADKIWNNGKIDFQLLVDCKLVIELDEQVFGKKTNYYTAILRAVASQLLPKNWQWEIVDIVGQQSELMIIQTITCDDDLNILFEEM